MEEEKEDDDGVSQRPDDLIDALAFSRKEAIRSEKQVRGGESKRKNA